MLSSLLAVLLAVTASIILGMQKQPLCLHYVLNICLADLFVMQFDPYLSDLFSMEKESMCIWQNASAKINMSC